MGPRIITRRPSFTKLFNRLRNKQTEKTAEIQFLPIKVSLWSQKSQMLMLMSILSIGWGDKVDVKVNASLSIDFFVWSIVITEPKKD